MQFQIKSLKKEKETEYQTQLKHLQEREDFYKTEEKKSKATIIIYENKIRELYLQNNSLEQLKSAVINKLKKKNEEISRYNNIDINNEFSDIFSANNIK